MSDSPSPAAPATFPLLTVAEAFRVDSLGLILSPDFPVPKKGGWEDRSETVTVVPPSGEPFETPALFASTHFLKPKGQKDASWRVSVVLFTCTPDQVPPGTAIHAADDIVAALTGKAP